MAPSCSLCRRRPGPLVEFNGHTFCSRCLSALGRFLRQGSREAVARIWRVRPSFVARESLHGLVTDEMNALKQGPQRAAATDEFADPFEEVFAQFKERLEKVVTPFEVETHLHLAIAYGEMGLANDALAEVAIALEHGPALRNRAAKAVAILFEAKLLRISLDEAVASLRRSLYPG